jgi:hypothetical protein
MRPAPFIYVDDFPEDRKYLPTKWEICPSCLGDGTIRPNISDETYFDMDPDERADYREGLHDRYCTECNASGKIKVVDEARCDPADLEEYRTQEADRLASEYEAAAERKLGA